MQVWVQDQVQVRVDLGQGDQGRPRSIPRQGKAMEGKVGLKQGQQHSGTSRARNTTGK